MRIKSIELKNGYKRFHDLTIDLGADPKKIVALVGQNGCGKSSVLDGITYRLSDHLTIGALSRRGYEYHSMKNDNTYRPDNNINIKFDQGELANVLEQRRLAGTLSTVATIRSPYRYNSSVKINAITAVSPIIKNDFGASTTLDIDAKVESNYRRLQALYNSYMHQNDVAPSVAKSAIIQRLNNYINDCLNLNIDNLGNIEADRGTIYFTKPDQSTPFEFNVLSAGEKEVIDLILDLYLRSEDYNDTIYLIDEPELHINTSIQRKLLTVIEKLIPDNCQLWITTHSIGFLRALQDELSDKSQIILFEKDVKWASEPQILYPIAKNHSTWKKLFATSLDDLANLVSPRRIVYCEGKDRPGLGGQEKGFDAQVYNTIFNDKHHDTLFISSGGNTELDQRSDIALALLTKVLSEINILVLKDRDMASGKPTSQHDRLIYLKNNPKNHRVLIRWEIENYLFDKEVLVSYCTEHQLNFDEKAYDQFVTDIENQNLKDESSRVKKICGIITSIGAEQFKLNLAEHIKEGMIVYSELESCIF